MKYKYISDIYNYEEIKNIDEDLFLKLQIKYKQSMESILKKIFDFSEIDDILNELEFRVPIPQDEEYNFYRKFSILGSKYVYLRNNIHIERLSREEVLEIIKSLNNDEYLNVDFINKTFKRVLFENSNSTFYGIPEYSSLVESKSLVFEFAYDQVGCKEIKQINDINQKFKEMFEMLKRTFSKKNIPISLIIYNSIPDLYVSEDVNKFII